AAAQHPVAGRQRGRVVVGRPAVPDDAAAGTAPAQEPVGRVALQRRDAAVGVHRLDQPDVVDVLDDPGTGPVDEHHVAGPDPTEAVVPAAAPDPGSPRSGPGRRRTVPRRRPVPPCGRCRPWLPLCVWCLYAVGAGTGRPDGVGQPTTQLVTTSVPPPAGRQRSRNQPAGTGRIAKYPTSSTSTTLTSPPAVCTSIRPGPGGTSWPWHPSGPTSRSTTRSAEAKVSARGPAAGARVVAGSAAES